MTATTKKCGPSEPLRDFDLASLSRLEAGKLLRDPRDDVDQLFLSLALIFNDIKSLTWFEYQLDYGVPDDAREVTPYNGQLIGFRVQLMRLRAAIVHELLELLRKKAATVRGNAVERIVDRVDRGARGKWKALVRLATGGVGSSSFTKALVRIRNVTFHYYDPAALADGFASFFLGDDQRPESEFALYSNGDTMEQTRFFFADAAAQRCMRVQAAGAGTGDFDEELRETLSNINQALKPIVTEFLRSRGGRLHEPVGPV